MNKIKNKKGITLIALIITIVILLILAAVAINSVQDDGILAYAQNSQSGFEEAQSEENTYFQDYVNFLKNDLTPNEITEPEESEETEEPETSGLIEFTIDGTTYYAESGMNWGTWVANTTYNTGGFKIGDGFGDGEMTGAGTEYVYVEVDSKYGDIGALNSEVLGSVYATPDEEIIAGVSYSLDIGYGAGLDE